MPNDFKNKLGTLVAEGINSDDPSTKQLANAVNLLLATSNFGPEVFEAFFTILVERMQAFERLAGAVQRAAKEIQG